MPLTQKTPMPGPSGTPPAKPGDPPKKEPEPFKWPEPQAQDTSKSKGCWKKTYMRGMGKKIDSCQDGEELGGRKCYELCKSGFTGWGSTCYKDCQGVP